MARVLQEAAVEFRTDFEAIFPCSKIPGANQRGICRLASMYGRHGLPKEPVLEQAERWIASRPPGAPAPTDETQAFIRHSRQGATRRRNVLTGSLAAGLVLALVLAGLAYWQRGVAVEQRSIAQQNEVQAKQERDNAERNFKLAQKTADSLVTDIARGLRSVFQIQASKTKISFAHSILRYGVEIART
jgi:hypothetical protein